MPSSIAKHLREMNITLPQVAAPVANYVPVVISGNMLFVSGQLPLLNGALSKGCLGKDATPEQGYEAAKACALNIVAQVAAALGGNLDRVARCVKLSGFVTSTPEFFDHPKVINGASDFIVAVFGEAGKHSRAAVGVPSLPLGAMVEVEAIFEIRDAV